MYFVLIFQGVLVFKFFFLSSINDHQSFRIDIFIDKKESTSDNSLISDNNVVRIIKTTYLFNEGFVLNDSKKRFFF